MSQGKAGEEGGAASSDVEAASPAEPLTTFVFGTCSRVSATPMTADSTLERGGANDVSSSLRRHLRAPTTLLEEEREEEAMPQGAGGAAWSDAVSRVVTRMALQRLLELATGAVRNLLRGLGEATPARRVAPLGQFADVLLSSIDAIQQLASAEFLAAEFREFPAAEFRAPVEDSAAATSPRGSPEERPTLPPHRLLPVPATTTPGSAEWEGSLLLQEEERLERELRSFRFRLEQEMRGRHIERLERELRSFRERLEREMRGRHLLEGPERLARARNREHRVLEGQGPEAMSSLRGGPLLEPLPEPLLRGDPQVGAPLGLVAAAARPSRWTPGRMAFADVEFRFEQARTAAPPPARRRSSSSSSSPTEELGAEPLRWIIARSAAGGDDLSPPRREPRWTLARSRSPPRREPRS